MEAAEGMSPAERMQMIEGMVSGLSERLATTGGPPEDWARLIRAYGVLGRREQAAAIWAEAQQVFDDEVARLPILRAARDAGVAQ
jgi:cytochrome c-type biogenesis protein CcmH